MCSKGLAHIPGRSVNSTGDGLPCFASRGSPVRARLAPLHEIKPCEALWPCRGLVASVGMSRLCPIRSLARPSFAVRTPLASPAEGGQDAIVPPAFWLPVHDEAPGP